MPDIINLSFLVLLLTDILLFSWKKNFTKHLLPLLLFTYNLYTYYFIFILFYHYYHFFKLCIYNNFTLFYMNYVIYNLVYYHCFILFLKFVFIYNIYITFIAIITYII